MAAVQSIDPHAPTSLPDGRIVHYRQIAEDVDPQHPEVIIAVRAHKLRLLPDGDDVQTLDVAQSTIDEILEWVGDEPDRASYALAAERERPDRQQRTSLIAKLEQLAGDITPDSDDEGAQK